MGRIETLPSINKNQVIEASDTLIIDTNTGTKKITVKELLSGLALNGGGSSGGSDSGGTNSTITYLPTSVWKGKTFVAYGTSITQESQKFSNNYLEIIKKRCGFKSYTNRGWSGRALCHSKDNGQGISERIKDTDGVDDVNDAELIRNADLLILECGSNDFKLEIPLGSITMPTGYKASYGSDNKPEYTSGKFRTDTFYGCLQDTIEYIYHINPQIKILLITDPHRENIEEAKRQNNYGYMSYDENSLNHTLLDYVNAVKEVSNIYAIPVCDWFNESGINLRNLRTYTGDGLHPNDAGYLRLGNFTAACIENMYCDVDPADISQDVETGGSEDIDIIEWVVDTSIPTAFTMTQGSGAFTSDGKLASSKNFYVSPWIRVPKNTKLVIKDSADGINALAYWDEPVTLSTTQTSDIHDYKTYKVEYTVITENADKYVKFFDSQDSSSTVTLTFYKNKNNANAGYGGPMADGDSGGGNTEPTDPEPTDPALQYEKDNNISTTINYRYGRAITYDANNPNDTTKTGLLKTGVNANLSDWIKVPMGRCLIISDPVNNSSITNCLCWHEQVELNTTFGYIPDEFYGTYKTRYIITADTRDKYVRFFTNGTDINTNITLDWRKIPGSADVVEGGGTIVDKTISRITAEYTGATLYEGDTLSGNDIRVTVYYSDGTNEKITNGFSKEGPSTIKTGDNVYTIEYEGFSTTLTVTGQSKYEWVTDTSLDTDFTYTYGKAIRAPGSTSGAAGTLTSGNAYISDMITVPKGRKLCVVIDQTLSSQGGYFCWYSPVELNSTDEHIPDEYVAPGKYNEVNREDIWYTEAIDRTKYVRFWTPGAVTKEHITLKWYKLAGSDDVEDPVIPETPANQKSFTISNLNSSAVSLNVPYTASFTSYKSETSWNVSLREEDEYGNKYYSELVAGYYLIVDKVRAQFDGVNGEGILSRKFGNNATTYGSNTYKLKRLTIESLSDNNESGIVGTIVYFDTKPTENITTVYELADELMEPIAIPANTKATFAEYLSIVAKIPTEMYTDIQSGKTNKSWYEVINELGNSDQADTYTITYTVNS